MGIIFGRSKKQTISRVTEPSIIISAAVDAAGSEQETGKVEKESRVRLATPIPTMSEHEVSSNVEEIKSLDQVEEVVEPVEITETEPQEDDSTKTTDCEVNAIKLEEEKEEEEVANEIKQGEENEEEVEKEEEKEEKGVEKEEEEEKKDEVLPDDDDEKEIKAEEEKDEKEEAGKEENEKDDPVEMSESKNENSEDVTLITEMKPSEETNLENENKETEIQQPQIVEMNGENVLPQLRLTPITAKTIPKNYSSTLGIIWQWGRNTDDLTWDVNFPNTGEVEISVDFHDIQLENPFTFTVSICDDQFECECNDNGNYLTFPLDSNQDEIITRVTAGTLLISEPGSKTITAKVEKMTGEHVGNLRLLELKGAGVEGAVIESQIANTVSSVWEIKECQLFYTAVEIVDSSPGTLFGVCCFSVLELGLYDCQGHRSVWFRINHSPGDDPEESSQILEAGEDVKLTDKRVEESKCFEGVFQFPWNFDTVYHFMVKMEEVDNSFQYSFYFYKDAEETWKRVVVFKTSFNEPESESNFKSLIEDRRKGEVKCLRRANFGPTWYLKENEWHQVETVLPHLVGHVVNAGLSLLDDKICLLISPDPVDQTDVYTTKKLSVGNSVPSVLESFSEIST